MSSKTKQAVDAIANELDSIAAVSRLGRCDVIRQVMPKVKREELDRPKFFVTYSGWEQTRETRTSFDFVVSVDVAIVAPLDSDENRADEESEFYLDQLEQVADLLFPKQFEGWRVIAIECLTPADADRWRTQRMYAGILRLTTEQQ